MRRQRGISLVDDVVLVVKLILQNETSAPNEQTNNLKRRRLQIADSVGR